LKLTEENILKLSHGIGIRYCSRKAIDISLLGEYLRIKAYLQEENRKKMMQARQLGAEGMEAREIGKLLLVTNKRAGQWARGNVQSPVVKSAQLASFDEWSRTARTNLKEPLLWESVVSIESEAISEVRDLTVSDSSHSFFANGFLVHNCDDHYHIDQLRDMLKEDKVYGILAIDSTEAGLGILSGDSLEVVDVVTSGVSGKTRKGGQSARRYERAREMELTYFFNRVGEHATRSLLNSNKVSGLIVGGPGPTKEEFVKGGYLHYQLQQNILAVIDTGYSGREGVREVVEKASDVLQNVRFVEEKKLVQRFLMEINKPNGLAIYGLPRIMAALEKANVETVLVSDDVNTTRIRMTCKNCKTPKEEMVANQRRMQTMQEMISTPCAKCGATDYDVEEVDIVDLLEEKAVEIGAKVEVISGGTEEGNMFKSFGGLGAFLRYRP
jgi:peptide chain release factor subunit 1